MSEQSSALGWKQQLMQNRLVMYGLIGGTASAIDVGLFLVFHELLGTSALLAHSISIPVSAVFSFLCNAWFNFKKTDKLAQRAASFAVIVFLGYVLGAIIIWLVETYTGFNGTVGKFVSLPAVFIFQYFLNSRISFRG